MSGTVTTDRTFRFAAGRELVWRALARTDRYRDWWPWLAELQADGLVPGARWRCGVRSPLRTMMRFRVLIDVADDFTVGARLAGDLEGTAGFTLRPVDDGSELRLVASIAPSAAPVVVLSRLVPTLAQWSHDRIIETGAHQFAGALVRDAASA